MRWLGGHLAFFGDRCSHLLSPYRGLVLVMTSKSLFIEMSARNPMGHETVV